MGALKWLKSKTKLRREESTPRSIRELYHPSYGPPPVSNLITARLPPLILQRIFCLVCPHTQDETYESCELAALEDTCMLCDARDLAHCVQVNRKWRQIANDVLYHSIRIDQVHYCEREAILAEKRKRKSFMSRNAEPEDTAQVRLQLLCRTLRDHKGGLALNVKYLKIPYMTRETCKADLARIISALPNLRYVDLPDGVFMDDPSSNALKQEVQAGCPDLRKMAFMGGGEHSLELLAGGNIWRRLEVLELSRLDMDSTMLRMALAALSQLRALKIIDMKSFNDEVFRHCDYLPPFPPLTELIVDNTPNLTSEGLASYLFRSDAQNALKTLSFTGSGVTPTSLHQILANAPNLQKLSITETVSSSFPVANSVPCLESLSLQIFHFEISGVTSAKYNNTVASHYSYLRSSLMSGGLPNLEELYVLDAEFPETLLDLSPPMPSFAFEPTSAPMHNRPSSQASNLPPMHNRSGSQASNLAPTFNQPGSLVSNLSPMHNRPGSQASNLAPTFNQPGSLVSNLSPMHNRPGSQASNLAPMFSQPGSLASNLTPIHNRPGSQASNLAPIFNQPACPTSNLSPLHHRTGSQVSNLMPNLTSMHRRTGSQASNPFLSPNNSTFSPSATQQCFSPNNPFARPLSTVSITPSVSPSVISLPQYTPGLPKTLSIFAKDLDEMEWNFSRVSPPKQPGQRRGSATVPRPISTYGLGENMGRAWTGGRGDVRRSVIVGNGFGGFLAVPADGEGLARPKSAGVSAAGEKTGLGPRRGSQVDLWR